jgi:hypothetical protein
MCLAVCSGVTSLLVFMGVVSGIVKVRLKGFSGGASSGEQWVQPSI